jgi:3,4-dihydroxy 2-butanone 4-phosphate synthase/GTP cyclohydrolase II
MTDVDTAAVESALERLAAGGIVVVADDLEREGEGDLVSAAGHMTTERMAFYLRHGSGIVCTPMSRRRADHLALDPMVAANTDTHHTAFTITVDHRSVGTGISAADRATTVRALADVRATPADFRRPGHLFPLRAVDGGVLQRAGHTEAAIDLLRLAGLGEVAVITELVGDDGVPLRGPRIQDFARAHELPHLDIATLARHRRRRDSLVRRRGQADVPTEYGRFEVISYQTPDGVEHVAATMGDPAAAGRRGSSVLVRVHSECLTGDVLGSLRCDCGPQLRQAMRVIAAEGCGVVVYLRGHEGRGIGLGQKLAAYRLQDRGRDTVDANLELGLPVDGRDYGVAAAILSDLGIRRLRLITNNPDKYSGLVGRGLDITERLGLPPLVTPDNLPYLATKRDRLGHLLDLPVAAHA